MCNGIKIVWLGCEKHSQNWPKNGQKKGHFSTSEGKRPKPTPLPHMRLWLSHVRRFGCVENEVLSTYGKSW